MSFLVFKPCFLLFWFINHQFYLDTPEWHGQTYHTDPAIITKSLERTSFMYYDNDVFVAVDEITQKIIADNSNVDILLVIMMKMYIRVMFYIFPVMLYPRFASIYRTEMLLFELPMNIIQIYSKGYWGKLIRIWSQHHGAFFYAVIAALKIINDLKWK